MGSRMVSRRPHTALAALRSRLRLRCTDAATAFCRQHHLTAGVISYILILLGESSVLRVSGRHAAQSNPFSKFLRMQSLSGILWQWFPADTVNVASAAYPPILLRSCRRPRQTSSLTPSGSVTSFTAQGKSNLQPAARVTKVKEVSCCQVRPSMDVRLMWWYVFLSLLVALGAFADSTAIVIQPRANTSGITPLIGEKSMI